MSDEQPPELQITDVTTVPASEVKPEDVGTLSLRYVDGAPVLVITGGHLAPSAIPAVNESGDVVATFTAGPAVKTEARVSNIAAIASGGTITADDHFSIA